MRIDRPELIEDVETRKFIETIKSQVRSRFKPSRQDTLTNELSRLWESVFIKGSTVRAIEVVRVSERSSYILNKELSDAIAINGHRFLVYVGQCDKINRMIALSIEDAQIERARVYDKIRIKDRGAIIGYTTDIPTLNVIVYDERREPLVTLLPYIIDGILYSCAYRTEKKDEHLHLLLDKEETRISQSPLILKMMED